MSQRVEYEIPCSCGCFFSGSGRGQRAEKLAIKEATDKYLYHIGTTGDHGRLIDVRTRSGLVEAAGIIEGLVPGVSVTVGQNPKAAYTPEAA